MAYEQRQQTSFNNPHYRAFHVLFYKAQRALAQSKRTKTSPNRFNVSGCLSVSLPKSRRGLVRMSKSIPETIAYPSGRNHTSEVDA
jgi:hypothetical protein